VTAAAAPAADDLAAAGPGPRPPEHALRAALHDGRLLVDRNLLLLWRSPSAVGSMLVFPLIFLFGFFAVLERSMDAAGIDYAQYLPPAVVVQAMFFAGISSAFFLADDRLTGRIERFRSLPLHRWAVIVARVGADTVRAVVSMVVVLLGATALGFRFHAGAVAAVGFVLVVVLFAVCVAAGCGVIGLRAKSPEAATSTLFLPYLPLLMLSTAFVPLEGFPGWIQPFVRWQPVSLTVDALRALSAGGPTLRPVLEAAIALTVLLVVFGALGARAFRRAA
jgi:ABC-2 type transport system permease protein